MNSKRQKKELVQKVWYLKAFFLTGFILTGCWLKGSNATQESDQVLIRAQEEYWKSLLKLSTFSEENLKSLKEKILTPAHQQWQKDRNLEYQKYFEKVQTDSRSLDLKDQKNQALKKASDSKKSPSPSPVKKDLISTEKDFSISTHYINNKSSAPFVSGVERIEYVLDSKEVPKEIEFKKSKSP